MRLNLMCVNLIQNRSKFRLDTIIYMQYPYPLVYPGNGANKVQGADFIQGFPRNFSANGI